LVEYAFQFIFKRGKRVCFVVTCLRTREDSSKFCVVHFAYQLIDSGKSVQAK